MPESRGTLSRAFLSIDSNYSHRLAWVRARWPGSIMLMSRKKMKLHTTLLDHGMQGNGTEHIDREFNSRCVANRRWQSRGTRVSLEKLLFHKCGDVSVLFLKHVFCNRNALFFFISIFGTKCLVSLPISISRCWNIEKYKMDILRNNIELKYFVEVTSKEFITACI